MPNDLGALGGGALGKPAGADAGVEQPAPAVVIVGPAGRRIAAWLSDTDIRFSESICTLAEPVPLVAETPRIGTRPHEARDAGA